ncbi:MAG: hypothetical protein KDK23_13065 [Leptospiraceae bacterium]|nr:hypothetical protein [Leptospiraceae bacterium]
MDFIQILEDYFRGEKLEAAFFIMPVGLVLIGFGIVALKAETGGFAWGVAAPCFLFGLILLITGATVAFRTNAQVEDLKQKFEQSPAAMASAELPRMEKVNRNFRMTFYAFGGIALMGLILHYLGMDWARGLGAVLILAAALGLLIDGFAERRAEPYTKALESIVKS